MSFALPFQRRRSLQRPIPILAYHALNAPDKDYASNDHVALEEDLKLVRKLGFKVAPLTEIAEFTWNHAPSRLDSEQWVGLSFDDGTDFDYLDIEAHPYLGHVKSFYTILKESGTSGGRDWPQPTGTAFVIASPEARAVLDKTCIAGLNQWRDVWWVEAAQTGILEIGNHSWDHTHPTLDTVAQRDSERVRSRASTTSPTRTLKSLRPTSTFSALLAGARCGYSRILTAKRRTICSKNTFRSKFGGTGCSLHSPPQAAT